MDPNDFPPAQLRGTLEPWGQTSDLIARPRDEVGLQYAGRPVVPVVQVQDRHRAALLRGSTRYTVGLVSTLVLDWPTTVRNLIVIRNASAGAQIVYLECGNDADAESPIILNPGEVWVADSVVPQDQIFAIASAAGARVTVAQSQYQP